MPRPTIRFNDYVSLAIMLLMSVALIAGQAGASVDESESVYESAQSIGSIVLFEDRGKLEVSGLIGEKALEISISVVNDLSHFRGEDE